MQTTAIIDGRLRAPAIMSARSGRGVRSIRHRATFVVACLIEAILILGFVVASLGLGYEGYPGAGPDRPPPPPAPAPAPPPDSLRIAP
jgi:hypothetical protein